MDRRRAAGSLLALAACFAFATAAPTASNHTALDLYDGAPEGCYYNFQHYGEGDRIMTNEPCLNCTCHNRMLMCYLRVCPFTKPIGQDCTIEKRADQCCPIVTCPDVPVDLLTSTTNSPAEYGATGLGKLDKYGCSINGKYFPEGAKVPPTPNKPCEHCYCIRNMTTCVMQECTLHVDGCTPIYHKDVCCPVRYSCDHPEDEIPLLDDMSTTVRPTPGFLLTTTTLSPVTQMSQDCVYDNQIFPDGALIKTEKACDHCYCMKGDIVCVVQECGTPMENEGKNCTALPPREGVCCPDTYICEGDEPNTEKYDENLFTTSLPQEALTTLTPPRRAGSEGSGYRNEDTTPYTETPPKEPEVEGSGDEQETTESTRPSDSFSPTDEIEEPHEYISVTSTKAPTKESEITTVVQEDERSSTYKPHEQELGSGEEEGDQVTEIITHDDKLPEITREPESQVQMSTTSRPYEEQETTIKSHDPEKDSGITTSSTYVEEGTTAKSHEPEKDSDVTTSSPYVEEGTTAKSHEPEKDSDITTSRPYIEEGTTAKSDEPEKDSGVTTSSPYAEEETTAKSHDPEKDSGITTSSPYVEEGTTAKSHEPEDDSGFTTSSPYVEEVTTAKASEPEKQSDVTTSSPYVEEGTTAKSHELEKDSGDTTTSTYGEEITTAKSHEPEDDSGITTSSPHVEEGTTAKAHEPEKESGVTTSSPYVEEGTTAKSHEPEKDSGVTTSSLYGEERTTIKSSEPEIVTDIERIATTESPQSYPVTKDQTTPEVSEYEPQSETKSPAIIDDERKTTKYDETILSTKSDEYLSHETTPQQHSPSTTKSPGVEDDVSTEPQDIVTERAEEPDLEPHPHYAVTASTPMLEEIEKETTEYSVKEPTPSDALIPSDLSTKQPITEHTDKQETEPQKFDDDISDYITTMSPTFEKDDTEPLDSPKVTEADDSDLQYSPTTLSPSIDEEDKKTSPEKPFEITKDTKTESYAASTTSAAQLEYSERTTAEPDKGLNTIPGTLEEEYTIEPTDLEKTTISDEKQGTDEDIPIDTRIIETSSPPSVETSASETSTKKEIDGETPEVITSAADKVTVPPTKSDDIQTESTQAEKETPAESPSDATSKPLYEPTAQPEDFKTDRDNVVPTVSYDKVSETTTANLEENEIFNEPRIPGEGDCLINGVTYRNESTVPSTNKCLSDCKCVSSIVKCDPIICSPPPEYMENCRTMYDPSDSCCPTYICDHKTETMPPQPHSQMSGTESPTIAPVLCHGDECEIQKDKIPTEESSKPCESGNCQSDIGVPASETEVQCTEDSGCHASPTKPCDGDDCKTISDKVEPEQQPCTSSDCGISPTKETEVPKEICEGEEGCKTSQEPVELECKDDNCRRKDTSDSEQRPPIKCTGSECQPSDISPAIDSSTQKEEYSSQTNKLESDVTKPSEESIPTESSKLPELETAPVDKSGETIPTTPKSELPQEFEPTKHIEATISPDISQDTEITKVINEYSTEPSVADVEGPSKPTYDIDTEPSKLSTSSDVYIDTKSPEEEKIEPIVTVTSQTTTIPEIQKDVTTLSDNLPTIKEDSKPTSELYETMDDSVTKSTEEAHTEPSKTSDIDQEKSSAYPSSETTTESFEITEDHKSTQTQESDEGKKATTKAIEMSTESYDRPEVVTPSEQSDKEKIPDGITTGETEPAMPSEITQAPISVDRETEPTKIFETQPEASTDIPKVPSEAEATKAPEYELSSTPKSQDINDETESEPETTKTDKDTQEPTTHTKPHSEDLSTVIPTGVYEKEEKPTTVAKSESETYETTVAQETGGIEKTTVRPITQDVEPETTVTSETSEIEPLDATKKAEDSTKPASDEHLPEIVTHQYDTYSTEPVPSHPIEPSDDVPHKDITESSYDREHEKPTTASDSEPKDKYSYATEISDAVPKVTVVPQIENVEKISTISSDKTSSEAETIEDKPEPSTKSPEHEIPFTKEPESTDDTEKDVSSTESSDKKFTTEKVITEPLETEKEILPTDKYEDTELETPKPIIDVESPVTPSTSIGLDVTTKFSDEETSKFTTTPVTDFDTSSKKDSDKPSTDKEEETLDVTKPTEDDKLETSKEPEDETQKETSTPESDLMTELPIKTPEQHDKDHTETYNLATEKSTPSSASDVTREEVTEPSKIYDEITKATPTIVDEQDKFTTASTDYASTKPSQILDEDLEKSSKPAEPTEEVTTPVTPKEDDIVTPKVEIETSSIKQDMDEKSETEAPEPLDEATTASPSDSVPAVTSESEAATPSTTHDLVSEKIPLSTQEEDSASKATLGTTTEAFDKVSKEEDGKISPTTNIISDIQTTEPTRKFDSEPEKATTSGTDENIATVTKDISDIEKPATEPSVVIDESSKPTETSEKDEQDIEIETSTKSAETDAESGISPVTQESFTIRQPITDLLSSELPQESSTDTSSYTPSDKIPEHDDMHTDSVEPTTGLPDVPYKESETSATEKEVTKPSEIIQEVTTEVVKTSTEAKLEDIPVPEVVESTTGHLEEGTSEKEHFETTPKIEYVPDSTESKSPELFDEGSQKSTTPASASESEPAVTSGSEEAATPSTTHALVPDKAPEEDVVTTDKYVDSDIPVQTEKDQEIVESVTPKQESSTSLVDESETKVPASGDVPEIPTASSPLDVPVSPSETSEPQSVTVFADSDKTISPEEPVAIPVQTEKVPDLIEKPSPEPSHDTASPEEDHILSTSKPTTFKPEEEMPVTSPADRFTKPEEKPAASPATPVPEQPKPIPSEPTDELPSPDEDAQFPSSGGYGQEPDYIEEDQTFGPGTCRYGGKVYVSAQQIPRDDPCDFCFCFRSDIICLQQSCPPPIHGCHEEPIQGFCCPRYECPVSMATTVNVTTTTTTTTTTLPPHFPIHGYKGSAQRKGCLIKGQSYKVGDVVRSSSGPCLHCTCGGDGQMKCDPKACTPEPMLRQMIAAAVSAKRRR